MASLTADFCDEPNIHKQSFSIDDLGTRSVTLYPARAAVVRDIENVVVKPGTNEITISNLTSEADESSVKVEGYGIDGLITDMTVELVANKKFIPESDKDDLSDSEAHDEYAEELEKIQNEIKDHKILEKGVELQLDTNLKCRELLETHFKGKADGQQSISSGGTLGIPSSDFIKGLDLFTSCRGKLFSECEQLNRTLAQLQKQTAEKCKKEKKLLRGQEKAKKLRDLKNLQLPPKVYHIKITIESGTLPATTKSVPSYTSTGKPPQEKDDQPPSSSKSGLRISYITRGASWVPRYDLRLDTTSGAGTLTYRANFINSTGETWRSANITLSTSQATFNGLGDKIPWMDSWRVSVVKKFSYDRRIDGGLYSELEKSMRTALKDNEVAQKRYCPDYEATGHCTHCWSSGIEPTIESVNEGPTCSIGPPILRRAKNYRHEKDPYDSSSSDDETPTLGQKSANSKLGVASSTSESYGLATVYNLQGLRTVPSSKLARRHVITEIILKSVDFSHIVVPKLQTAAFMKARIRNDSEFWLLKGAAGLTLDGLFLGNTTIPRCSPAENFTLGLGVDDAIQVGYAKPTKRAASQGMLLMKELVNTYTRSIWIHNTRPGNVKLLVLDQIPVSEDEKIKIAVLNPRGLKTEGDTIRIEAPGTTGTTTPSSTGETVKSSSIVSAGKAGDQWGRGIVALKKAGEVSWDLNVKGGKEVRLQLEYEAKIPRGESIYGIP